MNSFLQRYNVGRRLGGAFGLLILLSCLLVAAGLLSMSRAREELDNIVKVNVEKARIGNGMLDANTNILVALGTLSMITSKELNQQALAEIKTQRQRYADLRKQLEAFPADEEGKALRAGIDAARAIARTMNDEVIALATSGRNAEAQTALSERSRPATLAWIAKIRDNVDLQDQQLQTAYAQATQAMAQGRNMLIVGGVIVLIVSSLLAWAITRSLTQPLNRATRAAEAIADGRLDNDVQTQARDEPGRLLNAMDKMQTQLQRFSSETAQMIELHADKDMSHRMPLDFPGVYGDLSKGINTMMFEHLDAIVDAIAVLNEYANGDLRRDARRLPGSRAVLHQSMDAAKTSLLAINTEIKRLAAAAAAGDFSARGDAENFQHDFQAMVQGLNAMMEVSDRNLGKLSALLQSIAAGDLTARMHGEF
ncbi:MCP four helix bundle domain-containing protein, partial [Xanthomonas translucens]